MHLFLGTFCFFDPYICLYSNTETGWDLGPFAAVLAPGQTSPLLKQKIQRNYEGLKITACMRSWGKFGARRCKKIKKTQLSFLRSKSRVLSMIPAPSTTKGVGRSSKSPLQPDPPIPPTLTPFKGPAPFPPRKPSRATVTCFRSLVLEHKSH